MHVFTNCVRSQTSLGKIMVKWILQWKHLFNCSQLGAIQRHFGHSEWRVYFPGSHWAFAKQTSRIATTKKPVNETNQNIYMAIRMWMQFKQTKFLINSRLRISFYKFSHDCNCQPEMIFFKIQKIQKYTFYFAGIPDEGPTWNNILKNTKIYKYTFHFADLPDEGPTWNNILQNTEIQFSRLQTSPTRAQWSQGLSPATTRATS